jgi:hypothetical protein
VVTKDRIENWAEPLEELLGWLDSGEEPALLACITLFRQVFEAVEGCHLLAKPLLPKLFEQFAQSEYSEQARVDILALVHLVLKSLATAEDQEQLAAECLEPTYELWMSLFMSVLKTSIHKHVNLKRQALRCIIIITRDLQAFQSRALGHVLGVWGFVCEQLPLFLFHTLMGNPLQQFTKDAPLEFARPSRRIPLDPFMAD